MLGVYYAKKYAGIISLGLLKGLCDNLYKQWRRKFAESGGAILLERKYFYGKKLKCYGAPLK